MNCMTVCMVCLCSDDCEDVYDGHMHAWTSRCADAWGALSQKTALGVAAGGVAVGLLREVRKMKGRVGRGPTRPEQHNM